MTGFLVFHSSALIIRLFSMYEHQQIKENADEAQVNRNFKKKFFLEKSSKEKLSEARKHSIHMFKKKKSFAVSKEPNKMNVSVIHYFFRHPTYSLLYLESSSLAIKSAVQQS